MNCEYLSSMSTMEIVIIILCSVILLGAIYNIVKIRRMKNAIQSIYDFCEQVALMIDKFNGDFTLQAVYIFKNYNDVSNYLDESIYNNPATSIAISLKHKNLTLRELQNHYSKLYGNAISREEYFKKTIAKHKGYFFNPFALFYEGVEAILLYTIGYLIKLVYQDFSEEQKSWKVFVTIVSLAGSIASIVSLFVIK